MSLSSLSSKLLWPYRNETLLVSISNINVNWDFAACRYIWRVGKSLLSATTWLQRSASYPKWFRMLGTWFSSKLGLAPTASSSMSWDRVEGPRMSWGGNSYIFYVVARPGDPHGTPWHLAAPHETCYVMSRLCIACHVSCRAACRGMLRHVM